MTRIVAGAAIEAGECGNDDVTAANLEQMAATLAIGPLTDSDRFELVEMLRWLAKVVRTLEEQGPAVGPPSASGAGDDTALSSNELGSKETS